VKETILLVGHGSRNPDGNQQIEMFANHWRKRRPQWRIEHCFIELADRLLDEGLDAAAGGSSRVVVVPLILNAAGHVKLEIPAHIERARQRHPTTHFIYAAHLGACEPILAVMKRSLHRLLRTLDMPDPRTTGVVLLGRGSSDRAANGEVAKLARWLLEETQHDLVDIAFTGITHPRLETVVQRQVRLGMGQIAILPYYLFNGTLMERIGRQVERLRRQYPQLSLALGGYVGFDEEIYNLVEQRALAAASGDSSPLPCDGCRHLPSAAPAGHHHHP